MILNRLYRFIANLLSPAGENARLSILIYHHVLPEQDPLFPNEVTQATFEVQMASLKAVFNVLPLGEAIERMKAGTLPARAACITFDDGYADNVTIALPVLQRHGLVATFFIATDYLNGGRMFNDTVIEAIRLARCDTLDLTELDLGCHDLSSDAAKRHAIAQILPVIKRLPLREREAKAMRISELAMNLSLPDNLMMTTEQLRYLHSWGMEIGAHTAGHPILANLSAEAVKQEIHAGKAFLEDMLAAPVRLFAYPNGKPGVDFLHAQAEIVREMGFVAAVATHGGVATPATDTFLLPRFTPWRSSACAFVPELLNNLRGSISKSADLASQRRISEVQIS